MQILWWLAPPAVATVVAMLWVSWLGREGRGEVDPEVAARRLGEAMSKPPRVVGRPGSASHPAPRTSSHPVERSGGVAVRPARRSDPARDADTRQAS